MKSLDQKYFENPKQHIPIGHYCYIPGSKGRNKCIFWDSNSEKSEQLSGYCHYLKSGDWEDKGTMLLWDQVKECGINDYYVRCLDCTHRGKFSEDLESILCNKHNKPVGLSDMCVNFKPQGV